MYLKTLNQKIHNLSDSNQKIEMATRSHKKKKRDVKKKRNYFKKKQIIE